MKTSLITLAVLSGTLLIASLYFYGLAIKRSPKEFLVNNPDLTPKPSRTPSEFPEYSQLTPKEQSGTEWLENQEYQTWKIESEDGLKLVAYYIPATSPTTKTAICAHGYTSNAKHMGSFARFFHEKLDLNV